MERGKNQSMKDLRKQLPFDYLSKTQAMMKKKRIRHYTKSYISKVAGGAIENVDVMECLVHLALENQKKKLRVRDAAKKLRAPIPVRRVVVGAQPKDKSKSKSQSKK